jgi:predicted glycosyltransferase involved in capsule biosynthesis
MATETIIQKNKIEAILKELQIIKSQLEKFLLLIPEESLKEYKNASEIKKAYFRTLKVFPPK